MPRIIALTGGIGAGKSTVAHILRAWGYLVFDCDSRAKKIMDEDDNIKQRIASEIADEVIVDGRINRSLLSEIVFADSEKLRRLNTIVHRAVRENMRRWAASVRDHEIVFVESAILYSSGLYAEVDGELRVIAPDETRIARVIHRNGLTRNHIEARIASQQPDENPATPLADVHLIINDDRHPVLPQLAAYLTAWKNRIFP